MPIPGTRSYFDPITQREEVWLEESVTDAERTWLRCKADGLIEPTENPIPVQVERCLEKIENGLYAKMCSLFRSKEPPPGSYYIPTLDGALSNQYAVRNNSTRTKAHLVFSEASADTPKGEILYSSPSTYLVSTDEADESMKVGKIYPLDFVCADSVESDFRMKIDQVRNAISDDAIVLGTDIPLEADRLCVILGNNHGGQDEKWLEELAQNPSYRQKWLRHQNHLKGAQQTILNCHDIEKLHFCYESLPPDQNVILQALKDYKDRLPKELLNFFGMLADDTDSANSFFSRLLHLRKDQPDIAKFYLESIRGDMQFLCQSELEPKHVYGLGSDQRSALSRNLEQILDISDQDLSLELFRKRISTHAQESFRLLNAQLELPLKNLKRGEILIIVIGGAHSQLITQNIALSDGPVPEDEDLYLENFIRKHPTGQNIGLLSVQINELDSLQIRQ